jgi:exonuclease SbcC
VTSDHLDHLNQEFEKIKNNIQEEITSLKNKQQRLEPEIRNSKLASELKKDLEKNIEKQKEKIQQKSEKENELKLKQDELETIKINETELKEKEDSLNNIKNKEKELFSSIQSIENVNKTIGEQLEYLKVEFKEKKQVVDELEQSKESMQKLENAIETLSRLREDIRNIREIIRKNFIEDFRQEFQKKFEEIRKYEEDYSVDIKQDYEPVAFAINGEEVPITNLSGGEKTSVALSYRLALADLAAQISSINPSEILILDEPTTGFDQEDVKSLPLALRNIKTIPQIIIVTHEEELKNAADYKFEVQKEFGNSSVKKAN